VLASVAFHAVYRKLSTIEELLGRKTNDFGLENREYGSRDPSRWPRCTLNPERLALTSPTSGSRSVGIVRSWTQATEFFFVEAMDMVLVNRKTPGNTGQHITEENMHSYPALNFSQFAHSPVSGILFSI
jgi:hypothetical protein